MLSPMRDRGPRLLVALGIAFVTYHIVFDLDRIASLADGGWLAGPKPVQPWTAIAVGVVLGLCVWALTQPKSRRR